MDDQSDYRGPEGRPFAVADSVFCCWDFDHKARTLEYLDGIDPDYFVTIAALLAQNLDSDDAIPRSIALRVVYHQGVETLISLLGATAQGPTVVPAWIAKCSMGDLKVLADRLRDGTPLLTDIGVQHITYDTLSHSVHRLAWPDETGGNSTAARFGRFWYRLAGELLDERARAEYNALKHGTRVLPGGFSMSVGIEELSSTPAPPEAMESIGGSKFGSTFFVPEAVGSAKWHIRTRRTSVNWNPESLANRLGLVSMSIANVVGALRCALGADPTTITFVRPASADSFDDVWRRSPGAISSGLDSVIRIDPADEMSRAELRDLLMESADTGDPPDAR